MNTARAGNTGGVVLGTAEVDFSGAMKSAVRERKFGPEPPLGVGAKTPSVRDKATNCAERRVAQRMGYNRIAAGLIERGNASPTPVQFIRSIIRTPSGSPSGTKIRIVNASAMSPKFTAIRKPTGTGFNFLPVPGQAFIRVRDV